MWHGAVSLGQELLVLLRNGAVYAFQFLQDNPAVAASVVVFLLVCILLYAGLLVWRRLLRWCRARVAATRLAVDRRLASVRRKSRIVAAALPHVCFWALMYPLWRWPLARRVMADPMATIVIAVILPWIITLASILGEPTGAGEDATAGAASPGADRGNADGTAIGNAVPATPKARKGASGPVEVNAATALRRRSVLTTLVDSQRMWLRHWAVVGVVYAIEELPWIGSLHLLLPGAREVRFMLVLWAVTPLVDGAQLLHSAVVNVLEHYFGQLQSHAERQHAEHSHKVSLAKTIANALIPQRWLKLLSDIADGGYVLFVAVPFFFAPGFVTHRGCTVAGAVLPAYMSSRALLIKPADSEIARAACRRWLIYWVVYVVLTTLHETVERVIGALPFWYDMELAAIILLQLPFTHGAERIFSRFCDNQNVRAVWAAITPMKARAIPRRPGVVTTEKAASAENPEGGAAATPLGPSKRARTGGRAQSRLSMAEAARPAKAQSAAVAEGDQEDEQQEQATVAGNVDSAPQSPAVTRTAHAEQHHEEEGDGSAKRDTEAEVRAAETASGKGSATASAPGDAEEETHRESPTGLRRRRGEQAAGDTSSP